MNKIEQDIDVLCAMLKGRFECEEVIVFVAYSPLSSKSCYSWNGSEPDEKCLYWDGEGDLISHQKKEWKNYGTLPIPGKFGFVVMVDLENTQNFYTKCFDRELSIIRSMVMALSSDMIMANVSHEIRTPLNGVIGYTQLLGRTQMSLKQAEFVRKMNHCCTQLSRIINDVIDMSKLSCGKMKLNQECFCVQEVADSVRDIMERKINQKDQTLRIVCNEDKEFVRADRQKIVQVIVNLVSNASKFSDNGSPITFSIGIKERSFLHICVKDNGIGIKEKDKKKIFNCFSQIKESETKHGSGLGLAISRQLVDLMGGSLWFESTWGVGTCFYAKIPFDVRKSKKTTNSIKGMSVLILDSNVQRRLSLEDLLVSNLVKVRGCGTEQECIHYLRRSTFDALIYDSSYASYIHSIHNNFSNVSTVSIGEHSGCSYFVDPCVNEIQVIECLETIKHCVQSTVVSEDKHTPVPLNGNIIIAEDVDYNRTLLGHMLESFGYTNVVQVANGKDATEQIQRYHDQGTPFEVILLDLRMPIMNGFEVIKFIERQGFEKPVIIAITASVVHEDFIECKKMGVKHFINKPINMTQLKSVLGEITTNNA